MIAPRLRQTTLLLAVAVLAVATPRARAQGCILIRESAPVIGSMSSTYLRPGEWEVDFSLRGSTADRHYSGDVYQAQRTALGTNVVNTQRLAVFNLDHSFTRRFSAAVSVPFVVASWSVPSPIAPTPGPRAVQHGNGFGDVSLIGRFWLFDTNRSSRNLSVGLGVKPPTGNAADTDVFVDITGASPAEKAVDQSVQPGDGGWGTQLEVQGFSQVWRMFAFGSANYLINPRDVNGTPSILVGIGRPSSTIPMRNENSVPDQFVVRGGLGVPVARPGRFLRGAGRRRTALRPDRAQRRLPASRTRGLRRARRHLQPRALDAAVQPAARRLPLPRAGSLHRRGR